MSPSGSSKGYVLVLHKETDRSSAYWRHKAPVDFDACDRKLGLKISHGSTKGPLCRGPSILLLIYLSILLFSFDDRHHQLHAIFWISFISDTRLDEISPHDIE